jgi:hypothetical protein
MPQPEPSQLTSTKITSKLQQVAEAGAKAALKEYLEQQQAGASCQPSEPDRHSLADIRRIIADNIHEIISEAKISYVFEKFDNGVRLQLLHHCLQCFTSLRPGDLESRKNKEVTGSSCVWEQAVNNALKDNRYIIPHNSGIREIYQFTQLALNVVSKELSLEEVPHA